MIEIKLPSKLHVMEELINDTDVLSNRESFRKGVNAGIDKVKQLNPSGWEVDEKVLALLIFEQMVKSQEHPDGFVFNFSASNVAKSIKDNSTKWLKPVGGVKTKET